MLNAEEKSKIHAYIHRLIEELESQTREGNFSEQERVAQAVNLTVNKLTPESNMLITSIYEMQKKHTLEKLLFTSTANQAAFYEFNIQKQLRQKFSYTVPDQIDYHMGGKMIYAYASAGAVAVVGGVVSICMESAVPVCVACIFAGIMATVVYIMSQQQKRGVDILIREYLRDVEASMFAWVDSIEVYYDQQIANLERRLLENHG